MNLQSLYSRIALVFAAIMLCLGAALSWIGYHAAREAQHRVLQQVSLQLAAHIAAQLQPSDIADPDSASLKRLFAGLTAVNPNIDVYLLDAYGRVQESSRHDGPPANYLVDLAPVHALANGAALPVTGDDPQHFDGREIFSAAPIRGPHGVAGYVYIVLLNDMYRQMISIAWQRYLLRSSAGLAGIALLVALGLGLAAFARITRRLQQVTDEVEGFASTAVGIAALATPGAAGGDEIDRLATAFAALRTRLDAQMAELKRQDELRRELIANVSHDLRTPLTSIQGYLETLARVGDDISREEQRRYLDVAVRQSHRVSHLANQLFELAQLEHEETQPQPELFSVAELVQDVAQKYALIAERKVLTLQAYVDAESLFVRADIGMIERVISNLLDNAIRHTPERGEIRLEARRNEAGIEVSVIDTGSGIPAEHLPGLLERGSPLRMAAVQRGGGLGLLIVKRILSLHGSQIHAASRPGHGTRMSFQLPLGEAVGDSVS
ncbi:MAG: ATP-binding protein [Rhodanobacter sp.]